MKVRQILSVITVLWVAQLAAQPFPLDYSYCGYRQSEAPIPDAAVKVFVDWQSGDNSARIQKAIDYVSALKPDKKTGLRGAVLLDKGCFELSEPLRIAASGVVLRGTDKQQTILLKKGVDRGSLIYIEGAGSMQVTDTLDIVSGSVALNARRLSVSGALQPGEQIIVWRPSTEKWIASLKCGTFGGGKDLGYWGWHAGDVDVQWQRRVAAVEGNTVTIDAPLSMALDGNWADSKVLRYTWSGRIAGSGVENLTLVSDYDKRYPKDEDHCWNGVSIAAALDCWVRMVDFSHFSGSAVIVQRGAAQITVEDCISRAPISETGGYRRRTFYTLGEKCLFQRCYSEQGIHDFSAGIAAAGPNAFVQCDSKESLGFSGSIGSWATGLLFDCVNIDGHDLKFMNLGIEKYGAGWNTANSTMYQCTAAGIYCYSPGDTEQNHAYGCWAQFCGDGSFDESNNHVKPWSLFASQLESRLGRNVAGQCRVLERNTAASSSPTIDEALAMTAAARLPRVTMEAWIDSAVFTASVDPKGALAVDKIKDAGSRALAVQREFGIINGKLVMDGALMAGGKYQTPWWSGKVKFNYLPKAQYGLTRFVPGMEGQGLTDRIDTVIAALQRNKVLMFGQNYGLWYDRRRDDHERVRRRDGDVWAPFYEQPFARSGEGTAWDGLSKYDLSRPNAWYYYRLGRFASKGASKGLLLFNQHYFQHNILEAGAHWVDCPWRSANNINATGFAEPVPFTGDKRIFTAEAFYDTADSVRRALHRQYIMQMLDAFADCPNVIHSIGEEFTGPLHFVRFWLQTISEWEQRTGRHPLIALAATKDVQDSILADERLAKVVDIIQIEQWYYHSRGLYAPPGGVNMAPRQYARKIRAGAVRFEDVYKAVAEYRATYPDKAVAYYAKSYPERAWAVLMAGGSCPAVPVVDADFLKAVAGMKPQTAENCYVISDDRQGAVVYKDQDGAADIRLPEGRYILKTVNQQTGDVSIVEKQVEIARSYRLERKGVFWFEKLLK